MCAHTLRQGHRGVIGLLGPAPSLDTLAKTGLLNHSHNSDQDGGPGIITLPPPPPPSITAVAINAHPTVVQIWITAEISPQPPWRTRIISTQHSVNIHWENVLQFILTVPQLLYMSSVSDPEWLLFVLELHILWLPKIEAMDGEGAHSAAVIHYS